MVASPPRFLAPSPSMLLAQRLIHTVCHGTEPRQMLFGLAEMLGQALEVEICALLVGNQQKSSLQGVVWRRLPGRSSQSETILLESSSPWLEHSWLKEIQTQEYPLFWNPGRNPEEAVQLAEETFLKSGLGLRTVFQEKVNGMVVIGSSQKKNFALEEAKLIEITDSLALVNHLFKNSPSMATSTTEVTTSVPLNHNLTAKAWYEATRQKLEQQRQSNDQLIHNIFTVMSDQTRNPLTSIRMGIEMLRRNPPSPEILNQRLDIIEKEWRKLNEINEKILQLKTLKFSHVNPQLSQVNLNFFVQQLVSSYQSKWTENAIPLTLKIDCPKNLPVFDSNTGYLQRIFDELLINAQKFALKNTNVTLKVRESQDNNQPCLVLKLSNLTQSVKCKNSRYFFDPFYREQWVIDTAIPGLGLGLTTTKELVEQLNAKIKVTCASADVPEHCLITFTLTFPLNPNG